MTNDKALEAARECPWHGDNSNLTVDDNGVGCFWVVCGKNNCGCEGPYASSREEAIAAWNRRVPVSALPGEAEVVAWRGDDAGGGRKFTAMSRVSEIWADQCLIVTPLVTLTSYQAMQARAEAAERERDYWQKLHDERTAFLGQCATEKEAAEASAHTASLGWADALNDLETAEARAKELEEALREAEELIGLSEHPAFPDPAYHEEVKTLGRRIGFGALMSTASAGWREVIEEKGMPNGSEFVAGPCFGSVQRTLGIVRTALKGGSNG